MLHHTGLSINKLNEVEDFYKKVLLFTLKYTFSIDQEITQKIFGEPVAVDVYMMENQDTLFEIFINPIQEKKVFSHVCLAYEQHETIYNNAVKQGYKTAIKENPDYNTYFIWDNSGNMFEIKKLLNHVN